MSSVPIVLFPFSGLTWYRNVKGIIQTFRVTLVGRKLGLPGKMLPSQHTVDRDRTSRGLGCAKNIPPLALKDEIFK